MRTPSYYAEHVLLAPRPGYLSLFTKHNSQFLVKTLDYLSVYIWCHIHFKVIQEWLPST